MKNPKIRILVYILAVGNLLLTAILYPSLPEQLPMHWDFDGTIGYENKCQIFMLCGMSILFAILFDFLPKIDPRRNNYQKFGFYYDGFCMVMQIFILIMNGIILIESLYPNTVSVPTITMLGIGVLFLYIGNSMPKFKSNFYMGIKTPWALSSEEVWRKTHRLGGKCFFLGGIVMILSAILSIFISANEFLYWTVLALVLIACTVPTIMSFIWWRQEQRA